MNSVFVLIGFFHLDSGGGHCCVSFFFPAQDMLYSLPAVALVNLLERGIQRSVSSGRPIRGAKLKWYMT